MAKHPSKPALTPAPLISESTSSKPIEPKLAEELLPGTRPTFQVDPIGRTTTPRAILPGTRSRPPFQPDTLGILPGTRDGVAPFEPSGFKTKSTE